MLTWFVLRVRVQDEAEMITYVRMRLDLCRRCLCSNAQLSTPVDASRRSGMRLAGNTPSVRIVFGKTQSSKHSSCSVLSAAMLHGTPHTSVTEDSLSISSIAGVSANTIISTAAANGAANLTYTERLPTLLAAQNTVPSIGPGASLNP